MEPHPAQLAALVAIADHGSFDAAARVLHITPSAVSQRIRALEAHAGQVLVSRGAPCRPTAAGEPWVRFGRQLRLLYDEAGLAARQPATTTLSVAINADSLSGWFRAVLADVAGWDGVALQLAIEDQAHSHELLRSGEVMAAVTSDPAPVQGCAAEPLGALRYHAAAAPGLLRRHHAGGAGPAVDWATLPMVRFNDKDLLQSDELAAHGVAVPPAAVHRVPASDDFAAAVAAGLGWGMLPEHQLLPAEQAGAVVRISDRVVEVPLFWQRWRVVSAVLDRLTATVRAHAPAAGPAVPAAPVRRATP